MSRPRQRECPGGAEIDTADQEPGLGPDMAVARVAAAQHGVVARRQLLARGLSPKQIHGRTRRGLLVPIHRGVYAVGHRALRREGWWLAAVLAAGPDAVLAGRSAAAHWLLRPASPQRTEVVARGARHLPGIVARRATLPADEHTTHEAIPVTTPMRTLIDLAAVLGAAPLAKAVNEAEVQRVFDGRELNRLLRRHRNARGSRRLRTVIADVDSGAGRTESELERRFVPFLEASGLPRPRFNETIPLPGFEPRVDCQWPDARLVVELDSRATHHTRSAFESDRTRDRRLTVAGWCVVRITWRELDVRPGEVAAHLRAMLGPAGGAGPARSG